MPQNLIDIDLNAEVLSAIEPPWLHWKRASPR